MPTPSPTPTAAQIVLVAEIMMVSVDDARSRIAADSDQEISDAKWAATLTDIASWPGIKSGSRKIKRIDDIEFFEGGAGEQRLSFRNDLRARYGLAALATESGLSCGPTSSLAWF